MDKKVLIVDKEPDFCMLMKYYLQRKNCDVSIALTIEDAFYIIENNRPDIIISNESFNEIVNFEDKAPKVIIIKTSTSPSISFMDEVKKIINSIKDIFKD